MPETLKSSVLRGADKRLLASLIQKEAIDRQFMREKTVASGRLLIDSNVSVTLLSSQREHLYGQLLELMPIPQKATDELSSKP